MLPPQVPAHFEHAGMDALQDALKHVPPEDFRRLVNTLPHLVPTVPDEFVAYLLQRAGLVPEDDVGPLNSIATTRLVALAAQMVVESAVHDATKLAERRHVAGQPKDLHRLGYNARASARQYGVQLRTEDVSDALCEIGVDFRPRPFYADSEARAASNAP